MRGLEAAVLGVVAWPLAFFSTGSATGGASATTGSAEGMAMGEVAALEGVTLAKQRIDALVLDAAPAGLAA